MKCKALTSKFQSFKIEQLPKVQSAHVHALSMLGSSCLQDLNRSDLVEVSPTSVIVKLACIAVNTKESPSWMDDIIAFKIREDLSNKKTRARKGKTSHRQILSHQ